MQMLYPTSGQASIADRSHRAITGVMTTPRLHILLLRPFEIFFRTEALGGTVLILSTLLALVWANSPWVSLYHALWATEFHIGTPRMGLAKPLILWVNDLLMAIFFLVVGLEIKRELLLGELNSLRKTLLPLAAALGGMLAPALIFILLAGDAARGWGVPMATDIAFALGCLRLLGKRVPPALVVFLTAVAIIDDLGAILVIAFAYSTGVSLSALGAAFLVLLLLLAMNFMGVRRPWLYVALGLPLWVAVLKSGVHATIAGVIVGLCVPARALFSKRDVVAQARLLLDHAEKQEEEESEDAFRSLEHQLEECESPLTRLEHALHPWVAFAIVPIFALANAGVSLKGVGFADLGRPAALAVLLALFFGKQLGVFGATFVVHRLGVAELPSGATWRHVYGASLLAGIGFTMSLFIAGLAYGEGSPQHLEAKLGILCASLLCAGAGLFVLGRAKESA